MILTEDDPRNAKEAWWLAPTSVKSLSHSSAAVVKTKQKTRKKRENRKKEKRETEEQCENGQPITSIHHNSARGI